MNYKLTVLKYKLNDEINQAVFNKYHLFNHFSFQPFHNLWLTNFFRLILTNIHIRRNSIPGFSVNLNSQLKSFFLDKIWIPFRHFFVSSKVLLPNSSQSSCVK